MGLKFLSYQVADGLVDARNLIERIEDAMPPEHRGLRGKLKTARDLLTEVEDALADGPAVEAL